MLRLVFRVWVGNVVLFLFRRGVRVLPGQRLVLLSGLPCLRLRDRFRSFSTAGRFDQKRIRPLELRSSPVFTATRDSSDEISNVWIFFTVRRQFVSFCLSNSVGNSLSTVEFCWRSATYYIAKKLAVYSLLKKFLERTTVHLRRRLDAGYIQERRRQVDVQNYVVYSATSYRCFIVIQYCS